MLRNIRGELHASGLLMLCGVTACMLSFDVPDEDPPPAVECVISADCGVDSGCRTSSCDGGICTDSFAAAGAPCTEDGGDECDGAGVCTRSLGTACQHGGQCGSERCVDDVCCDAACEGKCLSCSAPGAEGSCAAVPYGLDPGGECPETACGVDGLCMGETLWADTFGGPGTDQGCEVAVTSGGELVLAGFFNGGVIVDLNLGSLLSQGLDDLFIAKFTSGGEPTFAQSYGDANSQQVRAMAVDSQGNIIIVGKHFGTLTFPGVTHNNAGSGNILVVKVSTTGTYMWSQSFGDFGDDGALGVAIDGDDNIVVTGELHVPSSGTSTIGSVEVSQFGGQDIFVTKLNGSTGNPLWANVYGSSPNHERGYGVVVDGNNDIIVTGVFSGPTNFGVVVVTPTNEGAFVIKLNASGTTVWQKTFQCFKCAAAGAALTASGDVVVTGRFFVDTVNSAFPPSAGGADMFVARLAAADGAVKWKNQYGGPAWDDATGLAVDTNDNVVISGWYGSSVSLGGRDTTAAAYRDAFVLKFDPQGQPLWLKTFPGSGEDLARNIAIDTTGRIYVTGSFGENTADAYIDLGDGMQRITEGGYDVFVAKLAP